MPRHLWGVLLCLNDLMKKRVKKRSKKVANIQIKLWKTSWKPDEKWQDLYCKSFFDWLVEILLKKIKIFNFWKNKINKHLKYFTLYVMNIEYMKTYENILTIHIFWDIPYVKYLYLGSIGTPMFIFPKWISLSLCVFKSTCKYK